MALQADIFAGKMLRDLRLGKGYTQEELGKAIGVTFQQVQKYEKSDNRMAASTIKKAADFLEVSPIVFFEMPETKQDIKRLQASFEGAILTRIKQLNEGI